MTKEKQLLSALVEKPTTYTIDVEDNSMLPKEVKNKKELNFVVKPPTIQTLAQCAGLLQDIPQELRRETPPTFEQAAPHVDSIIKVICTISWAKKEDYPDWYEPFLKANATPMDLFKIFQEVSLKMQTDFFLSSFQIASQTNPMMMRKPQSDSTPTN